MTFEQLRHAVNQVSPAELMELYKTCPATHQSDQLLPLERDAFFASARGILSLR